MGAIHDKFISWRQTRVLIIGQPDKMLRDLETVKEADSFSFLPQPTLPAEATVTYRHFIPLLNADLKRQNIHKSCSLSPVAL